MNILALIFFVVAILVAIRAGYLNRRVDTLKRQNTQNNNDHDVRDRYLDWILRQYELNVADPFVQRPRVVSVKNGLPVVDSTEKRCFHCNCPDGYDHLQSCPWVILRPLTQKLYPAPQHPATATKPNTIGLSPTR